MPAGVLPGHRVTFPGKGTEHPTKKAGSVQVVAVQLAHPRFEREGACASVVESLYRHASKYVIFPTYGSVRSPGSYVVPNGRQCSLIISFVAYVHCCISVC